MVQFQETAKVFEISLKTQLTSHAFSEPSEAQIEIADFRLLFRSRPGMKLIVCKGKGAK